jgi:hypothetical protein
MKSMGLLQIGRCGVAHGWRDVPGMCNGVTDGPDPLRALVGLGSLRPLRGRDHDRGRGGVAMATVTR